MLSAKLPRGHGAVATVVPANGDVSATAASTRTELPVMSVGVRPATVKLIAFIVGSIYAAVAGWVFAYHAFAVTPGHFTLFSNVFLLLAIVIGRRLLDFLVDLLDTTLDVAGLAGAVDDRRVLLADLDLLGFAEIVQRVAPAVVNIATTKAVRPGEAPDFPFPEPPPGSPFEDFFREFFDRDAAGLTAPYRIAEQDRVGHRTYLYLLPPDSLP